MLKELRKRKKMLERDIRSSKAFLESAPEGSLRVSVSRGITNYFHVKSPKTRGTYLSIKKDRKLISKLAVKEYCKRVLKTCNEELELIDKLIELEAEETVSKAFSKMHPDKRVFIKPLERSLESRLAEWEKDRDPPFEFDENRSKYKQTLRGDLVRSLAEKEIADALYQAGIPYKYEHHFDATDRKKWYPDFTIWKPGTGEVIIWEHCGMMDRQSYVGDFMNKMKSYYESGLFTGNGLILTFGDSYSSIKKELVDSIIEKVLK